MEDFDISVPGSDESMSDSDDASSDSDNSVDVSQAEQETGVYNSQVHPAPTHFLFTDIRMLILK
jgi:hypothetical protein